MIGDEGIANFLLEAFGGVGEEMSEDDMITNIVAGQVFDALELEEDDEQTATWFEYWSTVAEDDNGNGSKDGGDNSKDHAAEEDNGDGSKDGGDGSKDDADGSKTPSTESDLIFFSIKHCLYQAHILVDKPNLIFFQSNIACIRHIYLFSMALPASGISTLNPTPHFQTPPL